MAVGEDEAIAVEVVGVIGRILHNIFPKSYTDSSHSHCASVSQLVIFPRCMNESPYPG